jgi:hypothetical protein
MGALGNSWPLIILLLAGLAWVATVGLVGIGAIKRGKTGILRTTNRITVTYFCFGLFAAMFTLVAWVPISFLLGLGLGIENLDVFFVTLHCCSQLFAYFRAVAWNRDNVRAEKPPAL